MPKVDEDGVVEWTDEELAMLLAAEEAASALTADLGSLALQWPGPFTCDSVVDRWGQAMDSLDTLVGLNDGFALWKFERAKDEDQA